jgi:hypothetical protein
MSIAELVLGFGLGTFLGKFLEDAAIAALQTRNQKKRFLQQEAAYTKMLDQMDSNEEVKS